MSVKVDDLVLRVEAVLFASGKPVSVKELTEALGEDDFHRVQQALRRLVKTYDGRQTALEVRHVGDRYALKVKEEFVPAAQPITPVDIAPRTLKTLTLIAYHQPIRQSLLARMIGDSAYEEVRHLRELGLIHAGPTGATLELRTTRQFVEYFGIPSTAPEEIRAFLEKKLGVAPAPPKIPEGASEEPPSPPETDAEAATARPVAEPPAPAR